MRGLRSHAQHDYIRCVRSFAAFLGRSPDTSQAEDIRRYQVQQREIGVQPPTINGSVSALRFFFTVPLDRPHLSRRLVLARFPRKLPAVLPVGTVTRWGSAQVNVHRRDHAVVRADAPLRCIPPARSAGPAAGTADPPASPGAPSSKLAGRPNSSARDAAGADQLAHRFMRGIGNPDRAPPRCSTTKQILAG
jgi:hypothetical protein